MAILASLARVYVADLDQGLHALAASGITEVRLRFDHASGLRLALVGEVLVLAGSSEVLAPFRATACTVIVTDLDEALAGAVRAGARVVREPAEQATGRNATVEFPGGPVLEYVQWNRATLLATGLATD